VTGLCVPMRLGVDGSGLLTCPGALALFAAAMQLLGCWLSGVSANVCWQWLQPYALCAVRWALHGRQAAMQRLWLVLVTRCPAL
jgi:hypothetical protein